MTTLTILSILITVTNSMVLCAVLRPKNKDRMATPTNLLVANLALTDVLVGVTSIPGMLLTMQTELQSIEICFVVQWLTFLPTKVSVLGYLSLSIERYLAVIHPFRYLRICSKRNANLVILGTWVAGIAFSSIAFYRVADIRASHNATVCSMMTVFTMEFFVYGNFLATNLPVMVAIAVMYCITLAQVKHILRADKNTSRVSIMDMCRKMEERAAVRCGLLIGTCLLCQMPINIVSTVGLWFGIRCQVCKYLFVCLLLSNSCINPLLYSYTNKDLKREMCHYFRCFMQGSLSSRPLRRERVKRRPRNIRLSDLRDMPAVTSLSYMTSHCIMDKTEDRDTTEDCQTSTQNAHLVLLRDHWASHLNASGQLSQSPPNDLDGEPSNDN